MTYSVFDLKDKVALITGGNSGIDLGMADALAAAGAGVSIWGTNPDKNMAATKQLAAHGGRVQALVCDVADEAAVDRAFAETVTTFGRVDACYAATKGALIAMMKAHAVEFARHGIRANAILPGWIETAMTEKALNWDKFREKVLPRVPARRWGRPEDFGAIAVYLVSDASSYHTGDTFLIDGGYSLF